MIRLMKYVIACFFVVIIGRLGYVDNRPVVTPGAEHNKKGGIGSTSVDAEIPKKQNSHEQDRSNKGSEPTLPDWVESTQLMAIADDLVYNTDMVISFANFEGNKLLAVHDNDWHGYENQYVRDGFNRAIGTDGRIFEVQFFEYQEWTDPKARNTMYYFDRMRGEIFSVLGEPIIQNETYLLFDDKLLNRVSFLIPDKSDRQLVALDLISRLESQKDKKVNAALEIARYANDFSVYAVEFEGDIDDDTASIVIAKDSKLFVCSGVELGVWPGYGVGYENENYVSVLCSFSYQADDYFFIEWLTDEVIRGFILRLDNDGLHNTECGFGRYIRPT